MKIEPSKSKMETVVNYADTIIPILQKVKPKLAFSTDVVGGTAKGARQH